MAKKYYTMRELKDSGRIPDWLASELKDDCPLCEVPIISNYDMTERRCANPYCLLHSRYKGNSMVKKLGIKNVGPKTVFDIMQQNYLIDHVDILPYFIGYKPELHLWEVAEIVGIPNLKKKLDDMLAGWGSFTEYFDSPMADPKLIEYKTNLINSEKYFKIKQPLSVVQESIMMTGKFIKYRPREKFITRCNDTFGKVIKIKDVGSVNYATYLILGDNDWGKDKLDKAIRRSIPYGTTEDFLAYMLVKVKRAMGIDVVD